MDENSGKNPSSLDETAQSGGNEKTGGNEEGRRNEKFGNYVRIGHKAVAGGVRDDSAGRAPESTGGAPERAGVWLVNIAGAPAAPQKSGRTPQETATSQTNAS